MPAQLVPLPMDEEELVIGNRSTSLLDAQLTWPAKKSHDNKFVSVKPNCRLGAICQLRFSTFAVFGGVDKFCGCILPEKSCFIYATRLISCGKLHTYTMLQIHS